MTAPAIKRFDVKYTPIADVIARLDIDQVLREEIADKLCEALTAGRSSTEPAWFRKEAADFKPDLFRLLATDPLCLCAGFGDEPCPDQREIRVLMHLSSAPDGRADSWERRKPIVRCVSCGAKQFRLRLEREEQRLGVELHEDIERDAEGNPDHEREFFS